MKKDNVYALYHGDKFIDMGSKDYLAKLIGVSKKTIEFYMAPVYKKRTNCNGWIVIKVEEDSYENK